MPLPANARLQAAQSYIRDVRAVHAFLQQQDSSNADARHQAVLARLLDARTLLRGNPAAGRPARFLTAQSAQGRLMAARAQAVAARHGMPSLRELVVKPYVLLYAHAADRVLLLALRHERQLAFRLT